MRRSAPNSCESRIMSENYVINIVLVLLNGNHKIP